MLRRRQAEIAASFGKDIAKLNETAVFPDHVEQIPVLAGRRVSPLAGRALTRDRSAQPDKHRSSGRIANIADDPVAADTPPVGEIMAADKLGLLGKPAGEIRSLD